MNLEGFAKSLGQERYQCVTGAPDSGGDTGYVLGYFGARLARLDESRCRTVSIEVGLQNGGMATALAINTLKDPLAALAPAIFGPWMNISGSMLASWWAARPPKNEAAAQSVHAD